jgi:hypothetical protein
MKRDWYDISLQVALVLSLMMLVGLMFLVVKS